MNSAPDWLIAAQRRTRAEQCQFRQMRSRDIFAEEKVVCGGEGAAVVRLKAALRSRTEYWFSRLVNFAVENLKATAKGKTALSCTVIQDRACMTNGKKRRMRADYSKILTHGYRISRPKKSSGV